MTKITTYECNLCRQKKDQVWGLYWTGAKDAKFVHPNQAENHLCESCLEAAVQAYEKINRSEKAVGGL